MKQIEKIATIVVIYSEEGNTQSCKVETLGKLSEFAKESVIKELIKQVKTSNKIFRLFL